MTDGSYHCSRPHSCSIRFCSLIFEISVSGFIWRYLSLGSPGGHAPTYNSDLLYLYITSRSLRSSGSSLTRYKLSQGLLHRRSRPWNRKRNSTVPTMSSTLATVEGKKNSLINWKKPRAGPDSTGRPSASTDWSEQRKMGKRRKVGGKEGREEREGGGERDQEQLCKLKTNFF